MGVVTGLKLHSYSRPLPCSSAQ